MHRMKTLSTRFPLFGFMTCSRCNLFTTLVPMRETGALSILATQLDELTLHAYSMGKALDCLPPPFLIVAPLEHDST